MKRIFMIATLMLTAILTAQTATWTGAKTFGSTLKFLNVLQNDANTRIMSLDATGKPGWVGKSTLSSPIPTFEQVLQAGSVITGEAAVNGFRLLTTVSKIDLGYNSLNIEYFNTGEACQYSGSGIYLTRSGEYTATTYITPGSINLSNSPNGDVAMLSANIVNGFKTFEFPNQSGTLAVLPAQVFADNAAAIAGGLAVNQTYRTATGQVMIVY